jgi:hypothetical protein
MSNQVTRGSVPRAMAWMLGLSVILFWIPFLGGLVAGFVGGRKAGGVGPALAAALLPGLILFVATVLLGALLGWIPVLGQIVGVLANLGAWVLGFVNIVPLLIGAMIGGATAR